MIWSSILNSDHVPSPWTSWRFFHPSCWSSEYYPKNILSNSLVVHLSKIGPDWPSGNSDSGHSHLPQTPQNDPAHSEQLLPSAPPGIFSQGRDSSTESWYGNHYGIPDPWGEEYYRRVWDCYILKMWRKKFLFLLLEIMRGNSYS